MQALKPGSEALNLPATNEIKPEDCLPARSRVQHAPPELCHAELVEQLARHRHTPEQRTAIIRQLFLLPTDLTQLDYETCHIRSNPELRQLMTSQDLYSILPYFKEGIQRLQEFLPERLLRPRIRAAVEFGAGSDGNPNLNSSAQVDGRLILRECNDLIRVILPLLESPSDRYLADLFMPCFRGISGDPENGFRPLVRLLGDREIKDVIKSEVLDRAAKCRLDRPMFIDQPDFQAWYVFRDAFVEISAIAPAPVAGQLLAKFARKLMRHNVEGRTIFSRVDQLASCIHRIQGEKTQRDLVTHEVWRSKSTSPSLYFRTPDERTEKLAAGLRARFPDMEELQLAFQKGDRPRRRGRSSKF